MDRKRLLKPRIALFIFIVASLACATVPTDSDTLPTVGFSTATPGGRVSISLLTPTLTLQGPNPNATIIGPVATQTAAYGTAVAQTATAAVPSPTVPGILDRAALCPLPADDGSTPTLPETPPAFNRYAEMMVEYLSEGGAPTILEANLRSWDALTEFGGLVRADRDFTADGVPEVMVLVYNPDLSENQPQPGELYIFGCEERSYRLLYQSGYTPAQGAPLIHTADDITGEYINDLVYSVERCDGRICNREVFAVSWNLTLRNFESLLGQDIISPFADVEISDVDEDGLSEISVTSGIINDQQAGPQRTETTIYRWDGVSYLVSEVNKAPAKYRIHLIYEGDEALLDGRYDAAITAYRKAANDNGLLSWVYPNEDLYLRAFARYRMMLVRVRAGNLDAAQNTHDSLMNDFIPPTPTPIPEGETPPEVTATPAFGVVQPGIEFARMADLFWRDYAINRNITTACDIVAGYVRANPISIDVLNTFGYTNPTYSPADICPFGSGS